MPLCRLQIGSSGRLLVTVCTGGRRRALCGHHRHALRVQIGSLGGLWSLPHRHRSSTCTCKHHHQFQRRVPPSHVRCEMTWWATPSSRTDLSQV